MDPILEGKNFLFREIEVIIIVSLCKDGTVPIFLTMNLKLPTASGKISNGLRDIMWSQEEYNGVHLQLSLMFILLFWFYSTYGNGFILLKN